MYYKITNKNSKVYKDLFKLRSKELKIEEENKKAINEKVGLDWTKFLGNPGQQNFNRVTNYIGFKFIEPEKVDPKIWKLHKDYDGVFIPNRKTKLGREMSSFIFNGLKGSSFDNVFEILNIESGNKFIFPYIEIIDDNIIILLLDDNHEPDNENIIEIIKKEFTSLFEKQKLI